MSETSDISIRHHTIWDVSTRQMQFLTVPYYVSHFLSVLSDIERLYHTILSTDEIAYMQSVRSLPIPALCLYVRLINRKGMVFKRDKILYTECAPVDKAIKILTECSLIASVEAEAVSVWQGFTIQELRATFIVPKCSTKAECCEWIEKNILDYREQLITSYPMIMLNPHDVWPFLKYLYFGELTDNLSGFVVHELGHVVTEKPKDITPLFANRNEAAQCYHLAKLYEQFKSLRAGLNALDLLHWWKQQAISLDTLCLKALPIHDRIIGKLGKSLEQYQKYNEALGLYECHPTLHPERRIRLLIKHSAKDEAITLCHTVLANPMHAQEGYTVRQLLNRLQKRNDISEARDLLRSAINVTLPFNNTISIESSVLEYFSVRGWEGIHSENWLWSALFGLLLWDIIYDPQYGQFHQPLQMAPSDLYHINFYDTRLNAIEARLTLLNRTTGCIAFLRRVHQSKRGVMNPFISWHDTTLTFVEKILEHIPSNALIAVMRHMAKNVKHHSTGFPDLFLWRGSDYRFLEVKSPNDQLSAQQYNWLQFLTKQGVYVHALKVNYEAVLCTV